MQELKKGNEYGCVHPRFGIMVRRETQNARIGKDACKTHRWNWTSKGMVMFCLVLMSVLSTRPGLSASPEITGNFQEKISTDNPVVTPESRHEKWLAMHEKREQIMQKVEPEVLLVGDSITAGWNGHQGLLKRFFGERKAMNLGHSADKTQNILWRLQHHNMDRIHPKVAIVMAGTNNSNGDEYTAEQIAEGVKAIVETLRAKLPETKILLLGIFPRGSYEQRTQIKKGLDKAVRNPQWDKIDRVNTIIQGFADGANVVYLNINEAFLNEDGTLPTSVMPDLLHPNEKGYEIWGNAILPTLKAMMEGMGSKHDSSSSNRTQYHKKERVNMQKANDKQGFEEASAGEWKEVFHDPCTGDWQEKWFLDGKIASVRTRHDGMLLAAGPQFRNDAHHTVLWTRDEYEGDLKIEFEYVRSDFERVCVNILYIQATGMGEGPYVEDITEWNHLREIPAMAMYHDYMNTYHISYAAFTDEKDPSKDYVRARRYIPQGDDVSEGLGKGLEATDLEPDYFDTGLFAPGVPHQFTVIKKGQELFMKISNPEQTAYFHWNNTEAPPIHKGRIGLRHMFTRLARYKDFRISKPASE